MDFLFIYDGLNSLQKKSYAIISKVISNALKPPQSKGSTYLLDLRTLLHSAQLLKRLLPQLPTQQFQQAR